MSPTATTWTPCSACWAVLKRATPATHRSQYRDGYSWCDTHASPGDPPLTTAQRALVGTPADRLDGVGY